MSIKYPTKKEINNVKSSYLEDLGIDRKMFSYVAKNVIDKLNACDYTIPNFKPIEGYLSTLELVFLYGVLIGVVSEKHSKTFDPFDRIGILVDYLLSNKFPTFHITPELFNSLWNTRNTYPLHPLKISIPGFSVLVKDDSNTLKTPCVINVMHSNSATKRFNSNLFSSTVSFLDPLDETLDKTDDNNFTGTDLLISYVSSDDSISEHYSFVNPKYSKDPSLLNNFVYNLILYLQNYEEKITTDPSSTGFRVNKQKLKAKDVGQGYSPIRWLGKGYKIKYESGSTGSYRSPETHIRMGHWRNQPIGPRDKGDHKMVWIEPTLVNAN